MNWPVFAVPSAVLKETVTGSIACAESDTVKVNEVSVPVFPSFLETSKITTLHSKRRSCRWFLSPQPLPGFVEVGVVVLVEVLVEVDVEVLVGVVVVVVEVLVDVDVLVEVEVLVGVVVVVVEVLVEQYWYCDGVVQYW